MSESLTETREGKTVKAYLILMFCAIQRQTITNGALADRIGEIPVRIGPYLDRIHDYCERNALPRLAALTVNAATGEMAGKWGEGRAGVHRIKEAAYNFPWLDIMPPTPGDF